MAVTTQEATEYTYLTSATPTTMYPDQYHGRVRSVKFNHTQSGAGDATSSAAIAKLPAGRVRLLLAPSYAYVNWTTASATLDLGWDAYINASDGATVTADPDGLVNGMDVDAVGLRNFSTGAVAALLLDGYEKVFESRTGVVIRATSQDTAIADGDDLCGRLFYIKED